MGVNHKTVRQLVTQKKKTIRDRQLFTSQIFAGHLADMAAAQTRRYGYSRRVKVSVVWQSKNPDLANTENEFIWINAGHPLITKHRAREDRYDLICGLFSHELGHIFYTDFLAAQTFTARLERNQWYPEKPLLRNVTEQRHEADIWAYTSADEKRMRIFCRVAFKLWNIIEDGYIEGKMLNRYPGVLGASLSFLRDAMFADAPTLTNQIEKEDSEESHIWLTIMGLLLSYVKWGELKYGDEPLTDERVQTVFSLIGDLDSALANSVAKERMHVVNTILVRCWMYIKAFIDLCIEKEASAEPGTSASDIAEWIMGRIAGSSKDASGTTVPVGEKPGSATPASSGAKRAATAKLAKSAGVNESDEDESEENGSGSDDPGEDESGDDDSGDDVPDAGDSGVAPESGDTSPDENAASKAKDVKSDEGGRIPLTQTPRISEPVGGTTEYDDDYAGTGYPGAAADIERILDRVAEEYVCSDLEDERTRELNELAQGISYGDAHAGVNFLVHRLSTVPPELIEAYNQIAPPLLQISKALQRSITQQLQDRRRGGKQIGLLMGRRLDIHALPRNDGHIFYKNNLPVQAPQIALAVLGDESGSMSYQDRISYVRAAAIILEDFCRSLLIPLIIYGHTESAGVDLYSYAEYENIDPYDRYRLMDISSRSGNRDGAALRFIAERLYKRSEEIKLLFMVSDGQPAARGYFGTAAEDDLRGILHEYQRKGIIFIIASIGDDRENLQRIYGNSCMDITDLTRLPILLTQVVKQHIRL